MLYAIGSEGPKRITNVPHAAGYQRWRQRLADRDYNAIMAELERRIEGKEIDTSSWIPGADWTGNVFQPIYDQACGRDFDAARRFFGLLVWKFFMDHRDDAWSFGRYDLDDRPIEGMTYFKIDVRESRGCRARVYLPRARAVVSASHTGRDPEEDMYNWLPSDSTVRELTELDAGIFELLKTVTSADSHTAYLRPLQAIRRRQLLTHKSARSGAGEVDFANVLYHAGLSNGARLALDHLIEEYNGSADSLFEVRFQAYRKILDLQTLDGSDSELSQAWDARRGFQRQLARLNLDTVQRALFH